jgi:protein SCO1/2
MSDEPNRRRQGLVAVAVVVLAWLGYGFYQVFTAPEGIRSFIMGGGSGGGQASIGGAFELTDQNGGVRTDGAYRGQLMLVFFGYTHCPDVCPIGLQSMTEALTELGEAGNIVRPIFITVDPARDTPERMKEYAANFHPRLVALTGSEEQVARAAKAYRVYYAKAKPKDGTHAGHGDHGDYLMDHNSFIYLMGADGRYLTHFPANASVEDIRTGLKKYL